MSLLIRDIDYLIADKLTEKEISQLSCVNKYYSNIFDDRYYTNKFNRKYGEFNKKITKKYYLTNEKYLNFTDKNKTIYSAILDDRVEILVKFFPELDPTSYLKIKEFNHISQGKQHLFIFKSIDLAVKKCSSKCFKYFFELRTFNNTFIIFQFIKNSIKYKSNEILEYLYIHHSDYFSSEYIYRLISYSLIFDSPYLLKLYFIDFSQIDLRKFIRIFKDHKPVDISNWICKKEDPNYNKTFGIFLSYLSLQQIQEVKRICLERNDFEIIKLFTHYTSPFSK